MTATADSGIELGGDLPDRRSKIRQREILLKLEQWGPAYQHVAGEWLDYVGDIVGATDDERAWLRQHVAEHGKPETTDRSDADWCELRRAQGREANAAASAAFLAGDYDRARDLIDEALAYGGLLEAEWTRLHEFIAAKAEGA